MTSTRSPDYTLAQCPVLVAWEHKETSVSEEVDRRSWRRSAVVLKCNFDAIHVLTLRDVWRAALRRRGSAISATPALSAPATELRRLSDSSRADFTDHRLTPPSEGCVITGATPGTTSPRRAYELLHVAASLIGDLRGRPETCVSWANTPPASLFAFLRSSTRFASPTATSRHLRAFDLHGLEATGCNRGAFSEGRTLPPRRGRS